MAKLELQAFIEPRLLAVCRLQAEIINDLHPKVFGFPAIDAKVAELQKMFQDANSDEPLRKIQREAFEAGWSCSGERYNSDCSEIDVELLFEEWVKHNV